MDEVLIIKKYPNRRLYDTSTSRYITLEDVRNLVMKRTPFQVIDVRSEEDMTNYVLLQIITEEEAGKFPLFTTELLQNIIRYYGNPLQKNMTQYLEHGMAMFNQQFNQDTPFKPLADTIKENMELWQNTFQSVFKNFQEPPKKPAKASSKKKNTSK